MDAFESYFLNKHYTNLSRELDPEGELQLYPGLPNPRNITSCAEDVMNHLKLEPSLKPAHAKDQLKHVYDKITSFLSNELNEYNDASKVFSIKVVHEVWETGYKSRLYEDLEKYNESMVDLDETYVKNLADMEPNKGDCDFTELDKTGTLTDGYNFYKGVVCFRAGQLEQAKDFFSNLAKKSDEELKISNGFETYDARLQYRDEAKILLDEIYTLQEDNNPDNEF